MKLFKVTGPETSVEIQIDDDQMLQWKVIAIKDYESSHP